MMIFAERNRTVWISTHDSDQPKSAQMVWDAAGSAEPVESVEIPRVDIDTLMRTGSMAASYYSDKVSILETTEVVGIVVVIEPGESGSLERGDVLVAQDKSPYNRVARVSPEVIEQVEEFVYRRMGLR